MLLMLLRPQGATAWELTHTEPTNRQAKAGAVLEQFRNEKGYDIRSFPLPEGQRTVERVGPVSVQSKKPPLVYKLLGRYRWDGRFQPYVRFWD